MPLRRKRDTAAAEEQDEEEQEMKAETVFSQESFIRLAGRRRSIGIGCLEGKRRGFLADVKFLWLDARRWHYWVYELERREI